MIRPEEIEALKELLKDNKEDNPRIARSFLEDVVIYYEETQNLIKVTKSFEDDGK